MKSFFISICFLFSLIVYSQNKGIGEWTEHLPFQRGTSISSSDNLIYCGTTTGLFTLDLNDNSISRYSTVNILNNISIEVVSYNESEKTLLVIYEDFNIDILQNNRVINIPFIKDAALPNKIINEVFMKNQFAYVSTGFGIVKINLERKEITETYQFGQNGQSININSCIVTDNKIYAASDNGLYHANLNSNLLDFNVWRVIPSTSNKLFPKLFQFSSSIYAIESINGNNDVYEVNNNLSLTPVTQLSSKKYVDVSTNSENIFYLIENKLEVYDSTLSLTRSFNKSTGNQKDFLFTNNRFFFLNTFHPLLVFNESGELIESIKPAGPFQEDIFDMEVSDGVLWAVSGGHDGAYNNQNRNARVYKYEDREWTSYIEFSTPSLNGKYDVLSVNINPNNPNEVYFGCWGVGFLEFKNDLPFKQYFSNNSTLQERLVRPNWIAVGESAFDEDGNLWVVNSFSNQLLSVLKPDGLWSGFSFSGLESGTETTAKEISISPNGLIWVALPFDNHILVYDNNQTLEDRSDDKALILKQGEGSGNIPGIRGITMEFDLQGQLWIGTSDGIAVMFNPENVFDATDKDFDRVIISDGENNEILLQGTEIIDIKVDGANRKWVATNSGVYLLSEDGKDQIFHFTTENSPIYSNNILALAIDNQNGEVYISTGKGLISYRSDVIKGEESFSEFKVYPNPVRENYNGPIAISGLIDNSIVKITDINGQLVNELTSEGGQAIWDGRNFNGNRVSTGVYLVFNSALNSEETLRTHIGKILFIN